MHFPRPYALMLALTAAAAGCSGNETPSSNAGAGTGGAAATSTSLGGATSLNSGGSATGGSQANTTGGNGGAGVSGGTTSTGGTATAGGGANTGGTRAAGGTTNVSTGGNTNVGGSSATGGKTATGGSIAAGGTTAAGASATGGRTASGGSATTGGKSGTGGSTGTAGSSAYHPCPTDGTACKIMPFGDSITDGYNGDTQGGYRVELFRLAHSAGKNITFVGSLSNGPSTVDGVAFPHNHEGHSGWTIAPAGGRSGISTLVSTVMPQFTPHIVLLMIGTNDAIDNYDMVNAPTRLGALIDSIYAQLPNVLIVVVQPIPSRGDATQGDDTALSARIKTYDDAIPALVTARANAGKHILIVDMFTPFNPNKASLIEDQWHPNLAGYVLLGTQWYSVLQSLI